MNLYLLTQSENTGYDTFDSCVVAAPDEATARTIHPRNDIRWDGRGWLYSDGDYGYASEYGWAFTPEGVTVEHIGVTVADRPVGVVCASFNAG